MLMLMDFCVVRSLGRNAVTTEENCDADGTEVTLAMLLLTAVTDATEPIPVGERREEPIPTEAEAAVEEEEGARLRGKRRVVAFDSLPRRCAE